MCPMQSNLITYQKKKEQGNTASRNFGEAGFGLVVGRTR